MTWAQMQVSKASGTGCAGAASEEKGRRCGASAEDVWQLQQKLKKQLSRDAHHSRWAEAGAAADEELVSPPRSYAEQDPSASLHAGAAGHTQRMRDADRRTNGRHRHRRDHRHHLRWSLLHRHPFHRFDRTVETSAAADSWRQPRRYYFAIRQGNVPFVPRRPFRLQNHHLR
jgi:hypothetical protein